MNNSPDPATELETSQTLNQRISKPIFVNLKPLDNNKQVYIYFSEQTKY